MQPVELLGGAAVPRFHVSCASFPSAQRAESAVESFIAAMGKTGRQLQSITVTPVNDGARLVWAVVALYVSVARVELG